MLYVYVLSSIYFYIYHMHCSFHCFAIFDWNILKILSTDSQKFDALFLTVAEYSFVWLYPHLYYLFNFIM